MTIPATNTFWVALTRSPENDVSTVSPTTQKLPKCNCHNVNGDNKTALCELLHCCILLLLAAESEHTCQLLSHNATGDSVHVAAWVLRLGGAI